MELFVYLIIIVKAQLFCAILTLRKFKILHTPCLGPDFSRVRHGFGYDPKANVYKSVKIFVSRFHTTSVSRAQVYTLGTDSWREINIGPKPYCYPHYNGVYCKGFYYWMDQANGRQPEILSFDISKEEFHSIPLPSQAKYRSGQQMCLVVSNESIIFFLSTKNYCFSKCFETLVMILDSSSGVGATSSTYWRKHLTIGPLKNILRPLEFWKDDELLMETRYGLIVSYNLHTQKFRELPVPCAAYPDLTYASLCLKSLVSF